MTTKVATNMMATGAMVQRVEATPVTAATTISSTTPIDDTIPQNTEGAEVITVTITPTSATNRLIINFCGAFNKATLGNVVIALHQDAVSNALAAAMISIPDGFGQNGVLVHEMAAGTTSATTFKIRVGVGSGSVTINGIATNVRYLGGSQSARLSVTEVAV